jgi:hypothetical protein
MRNSAEAWSLADDVCLRDFLESLGTKLDENIRQVLDSLGKLEDRIEASAIHLGTHRGLKVRFLQWTDWVALVFQAT